VAPYYQPVIDLIAKNPPPNGSLDLVLELCKAVEAEHGEKITRLTVRVVKGVTPREGPPNDIPETVWYETMARMLFIGEHPDLELLLNWYQRSPILRLSREDTITSFLQGMLPFFPLPPAKLPEKELDRLLTRIVTALKFLLPAYLQAAAVAAAAAARAPNPASNQQSPGSFGSSTGGQRHRTAILSEGIQKLVLVWMAIHQQFLDEAWLHLGSRSTNRGEKLLVLRRRWRAALSQTFVDPRNNKPIQLAKIEIQLAEIEYGRSPNHRYLDAFLPHEARQFGFTPYDRKPDPQPRAKRISLPELFRYRGDQLQFLLDEYGEYYPPDALFLSPDARREEERRKARYAARRKLMDQVEKQGASLRLESEEDLVRFGCAFHSAQMSASAGKPSPTARLDAWNTLIDFVESHLKILTTHTEFNLDEQPSYFDRLFPRAINGGAWHDCGVYSVRLAFVFLSWAHCLKSVEFSKLPRVSFLMLPLHVGLLVELDGFPTIILHNNMLLRLTNEQLKKARDEWDKSPEKSDPTDPTRRTQKFLEDLAAQVFLRDVDTPLLSLPVAPVSAPPKKAEIWKAFQSLVVQKIGHLFSPTVENPSRPEFQFDIRFLSLLTLEKRWHDATVVPFWNVDCFQLWNRSKDGLRRDPSRKAAYVKALDALLTKVEQSYDKEIRTKKDELTKELRATPALLGKEAQRITVASRLKVFATSLGPVGQVREHLDAVRNAKGAVPEPPFATEDDQLTLFGE
jgi:hypothetical protein